jgi:hypothetical protein
MDSAPETLKDLLASQTLAVLSTHDQTGHPYANLVAFAASSDARHIWFATHRATRKYDNISADRRAAMLVDSRQNRDADFHNAAAATAVGNVRELTGRNRNAAVQTMLAKHPYLNDFLASPTCALLQLDVTTYYLVQRFQDVTEVHFA